MYILSCLHFNKVKTKIPIVVEIDELKKKPCQDVHFLFVSNVKF